jgi:hypothetical protein
MFNMSINKILKPEKRTSYLVDEKKYKYTSDKLNPKDKIIMLITDKKQKKRKIEKKDNQYDNKKMRLNKSRNKFGDDNKCDDNKSRNKCGDNHDGDGDDHGGDDHGGDDHDGNGDDYRDNSNINLLWSPFSHLPPSIFGNDLFFIEEIKNDNENNNDKLSEEIICNNPLCDHKTYEENPEKWPTINIDFIRTTNDLIQIGKTYHCKKNREYNGINLRLLNNTVPCLTEFDNMIGMKNVKDQIVNHILFFLQGFNVLDKCNKCIECVHELPCLKNKKEMLHTVIMGPPGVGKTCLARIIGKIYKSLEILSIGEFHEVRRSDLIAKYVGQTAIKTQEMIDKCKGSVMFIDEAYSLGHKKKGDSFAKECIDTLNKNLSDNLDFLCIIAGYKEELEECFFTLNEGLRRRFIFRYDITEYNYKELLEIFKLKIKQENWEINLNIENNKKYSDNDLVELFKENKHLFPYSGGDIEALFLQCKISHARRMPKENKKIFSMNDIKNGLSTFEKNKQMNTKDNINMMYI